MKRLTAIALSLLLVCAQVFVMAQPVGGAKRAGSCCDCKAPCCVVDNSSVPQPQTPATTPATLISLNPFALTASIAWLLPRGEAKVFSTDSSSLLFAARVPLFERDCALLI
jgi:hypothetical protein